MDALHQILKLRADNAALQEEVLQLRATVAIYEEIVRRTQNGPLCEAGASVSLPSCA